VTNRASTFCSGSVMISGRKNYIRTLSMGFYVKFILGL